LNTTWNGHEPLRPHRRARSRKEDRRRTAGTDTARPGVIDAIWGLKKRIEMLLEVTELDVKYGKARRWRFSCTSRRARSSHRGANGAGNDPPAHYIGAEEPAAARSGSGRDRLLRPTVSSDSASCRYPADAVRADDGARQPETGATCATTRGRSSGTCRWSTASPILEQRSHSWPTVERRPAADAGDGRALMAKPQCCSWTSLQRIVALVVAR